MNSEERELDMMVAELEQENRLLRARNERLEAEQHLQALHDENVRLGLYEHGEPVGTVGELFDEGIIWMRELDRDLLVYTAPSQSKPAHGIKE
jgi:hypothetical protein